MGAGQESEHTLRGKEICWQDPFWDSLLCSRLASSCKWARESGCNEVVETGEGRQEKASGDNQEMENDDAQGMENDDNPERESDGNWNGDRRETESDDTREMENDDKQMDNVDRQEEIDGKQGKGSVGERATGNAGGRERQPAATGRASPAWLRAAATSAEAAAPACLRGWPEGGRPAATTAGRRRPPRSRTKVLQVAAATRTGSCRPEGPRPRRCSKAFREEIFSSAVIEIPPSRINNPRELRAGEAVR